MAKTKDPTDERVSLQTQVAQLQEELVEQAARNNAAMAALQDRLQRQAQELAALRERQFWLDRAHIDPNAVMRSRPGRWARAAARALRSIQAELKRRPER